MVIACVAGMHRSGTSLLAQLLHRMGLWLGPEERLMPPTEGNVDGYFEHLGFVAINEDILHALDSAWDRPPAAPDWSSSSLGPLRERARTLAATFDGVPAWGWKDPRNSLTLPFWLQLFPGLRTIACVRSPVDAALSLERREGIPYRDGLTLWSAYFERLLFAAAPENLLMVHYASVLRSPERELRRVLSFLGLAADDVAIDAAVAAVNPELRHHDVPASQLLEAGVPPTTFELYLRLCDCAGFAPALGGGNGNGNGEGAAPVDAMPSAALAAARGRIAELEGDLRYWRGRAQGHADVAAELQSLRRSLYSSLYDLKERVVPADSEPDGAALRRLHREVREVVEVQLPSTAGVIVISGGDRELLDLWGRTATHFPQLPSGVHAGHHPAGSLAAIAQLEAQRLAGGDFLVVPAPYRYWLDHYQAFADHLSNYHCVHDDQSVIIFDLRHARRLQTIASPARTVAIATTWAGDAEGLRRWLTCLADATPNGLEADLVVATDADRGALEPWPGERRRVVSTGSAADGLRIAARETAAEVVLLIEPQTLPFGRWALPLLAALDEPGCTAVGGRILEATGTLSEAGGDVLEDTMLELVGAGTADPDDARFSHPRVTTWCSPRLLLLEGDALRAVGGLPAGYRKPAAAAAALCLALGRRGGHVRYEPAAVAVDARPVPYDCQDQADSALLGSANAVSRLG